MGRGACKTSHLGKNTLKNRRFLESNNADSGERGRVLPESGAELRFRCRRGAESENRLASPAVCRPLSAPGTAVSSLFFLERTLFMQQPHLCVSKTCPLLWSARGPASLSPPWAQLAPPCICWACFRLCPPRLGPPSRLLPARSVSFSLPGSAQAPPSPSPQAFLLQASGLPLL